MADKGPSSLTAAAAANGKEMVHVVQGYVCTMTIASPGVVTSAGHGFAAGRQIRFLTTGALPTGIAADTVYFVVNSTTDTFQVAATAGGTAINTSGSQSGTHYVFGNSRRMLTENIAGIPHSHAISDTTGLQAELDGKLDDSQAGAGGLSVLGAADAAAVRAAAGLVIGTDVQAFDAQLASLAALSYTGNAGFVVRVNTGETGFELVSTVFPLTVDNETSTSYTFALADAGKHKRFTAAGAVTATVPPNSSEAFPIGTRIRITAAGAGGATLAPGSGVTLNSRGGALASAGQYAVFEIEKVSTDEWDVLGDVQ